MSGASIPQDGEKYSPAFWRISQYTSFEQAREMGGIYHGEDCFGSMASADAMLCAGAVANCLDGGSQNNDVMVRLVVDGMTIGDFHLAESIPVQIH